MQRVGTGTSRVTRLELWVRPGEHQTLEDLRQRFKGRILRETETELLVYQEDAPSPA